MHNANIDPKMETAKSRKKQHIENFLKSKSKSVNYFDDIVLENNSIPELNFAEIDTSCVFLNKKTDYPIMINAITGGFVGALEINKNLASLAKEFNLPIAVGSQSLGIKGYGQETYRIVRDIMENGTVISNVSANTSPEMVRTAIDMINADAVQLHLNAAQEMCMSEGDRNFKGTLENIKNIEKSISVPVIIKEVGFGLSGKAANQLFEIGIRYIDIGGKGGTNFIEIEDMRNNDTDFSDLYDWGLPTPMSLIQCVKASPEMNIISSGGIFKAEDAVKSLCLGGKMAAISGVLLRELLLNGYVASEKFLDGFLHKIQIIMLLTGCKTISELKNVNAYIKGDLRDLIHQ
ncbi:MAG: type 2 isopentenyl-diphosphate Delta-isomerase [Peptostreptococcaceae bacterium]|nr:type 2 isopentenyl-diphosphate Delta-isomerase [Peptostreptococcaceae bacterium]